MQELVTKCDECAVTKKEGNRWIVASFLAGHSASGLEITVEEMAEIYVPQSYKTFCGLPDFLRYLSKEVSKNLQLEADKEV